MTRATRGSSIGQMTGRCWPWREIVFGVILLGWASVGRAALIITEIMYDPNGSNEHEYVEVYNPGASSVDLTGYKLQDVSANSATLAGGSIPAGGTAVIVRIDASRTLANYQNAWGAGVNFVETPTGTWPNYTNTSDTVTLRDAADNILSQVSYSVAGGFPPVTTDTDTDGGPSIYLKNVNLDPTVGANWAVSVSGTDGAYAAVSPRVGDFGSPGTVPVPEPASLALAVVAVGFSTRRRRCNEQHRVKP